MTQDKKSTALAILPPQTTDVPERALFWLNAIVGALSEAYAWANENGVDADRIIDSGIHLKSIRADFDAALKAAPPRPAETYVEQLSGTVVISAENRALAESLKEKTAPDKMAEAFAALGEVVRLGREARYAYRDSLDVHPHVLKGERGAVSSFQPDPDASPEEQLKARQAINISFDTTIEALANALRGTRSWKEEKDGKTVHMSQNENLNIQGSITASAEKLANILVGVNLPGHP